VPNSFQGFPTVPRLPWDDLYLITTFESFDSMLIASNPAGHVTFQLGSLRLQTHHAPADYAKARLYKAYTSPAPSFGKKRLFRCNCNLFASTKPDGTFEVGLSGYTLGLVLGFRQLNGKLLAVCAGPGPEVTVELEDWGAAGFDKYKLFEVRFNPGAYAQYYVDGILAATITTSLPTAGTDADVFAFLNLVQGALGPNNLLDTSYWMFWQEA
jgi:hypothetical protein